MHGNLSSLEHEQVQFSAILNPWGLGSGAGGSVFPWEFLLDLIAEHLSQWHPFLAFPSSGSIAFMKFLQRQHFTKLESSSSSLDDVSE